MDKSQILVSLLLVLSSLAMICTSLQHDGAMKGNEGRARRNADDGQGDIEENKNLTAVEQCAIQGNILGCESSLPSVRDGRDGRDGKDGERGRDGRDGDKGQKGDVGNSGLKGDSGSDGQKGEKGEITDSASIGTTFVRWGRTTCSPTSEVVYEGIVGGGHYSQQGGAANYLCLPLSPGYLDVEVGTEGARNYIFTAEFKIHDFPPLSHLLNHDVPCALCRVVNRSTMIMIPAKTTCPSGWTNEYKGYLMTAYNHEHQSEYVCVDENAETRPGTDGDTDGALLYLVESSCGTNGLPCPPYVSGYELACVVCTI